MARTRNSSVIKAEIAKLQEQLKTAKQREAERFASLAVKAGLDEIEISDEDLIAAFKEITAKFRPKDEKPNPSPKAEASAS